MESPSYQKGPSLGDNECEPLINGNLIDNASNGEHAEAHHCELQTALESVSKVRIIKNLLLISTCFLLLFTGFQALANLQSTLNDANGLGMDSQALIYASAMIAATFLPTLLIKRLGCKWTLVLTTLLCCPYIAANFYSSWSTFVPSAVLLGLGLGPFSAAQGMYVNELAYSYKNQVSDPLESVVARFCGIFSVFSENTQIWGNLMSYYALKPDKEIPEGKIKNRTLDICGSAFCNQNLFVNITEDNLNPPSEEKRYILVGTYLVWAVLAAVLLALFLDPLYAEQGPPEENYTISSRLLAAVRHLRNSNQLLLLPLTVHCGLEIAFYTGDFTRAYIACAWGVHHVGFVTICLGVAGAVMACMLGTLVKHLTRVFVFLFAAACNISIYTFLFLWQPSADNPKIFFIIAGVWGISDAVWWSQIPALYGILFKSDEEAAFSNFFFWSALGYLISYTLNNYLCIPQKIYILLLFLILGIFGYLAVEIRTRRRHQYALIVGS